MLGVVAQVSTGLLEAKADRQEKALAKEFVPVNDDYIIIDNRLAFATKEMAEEKAADLGCEGYHEHEVEGKMWFMPCVEHNLKDDDPCLK